MDRQEVITVLESLAGGLDPASGTAIAMEAFRDPHTVRALSVASELLRNPDRPTPPKRRPGQLPSAGTAWTPEEDARLCQEHDASMTIAQIALQHGRTSGAITMRLVKLGRIDPTVVKSRERGARVARTERKETSLPS